RPTEHLRRQCPLCFGGVESHREDFKFDCITCEDACFTQKRQKKGNRDLPRHHPATVFVPPQDVNTMEHQVHEIRERLPLQRRPRVHVEEVPDE
ncbi:hypothetical protein BV22DRAFT_988229, partial [Leucogyrophana mollusca]